MKEAFAVDTLLFFFDLDILLSTLATLLYIPA